MKNIVFIDGQNLHLSTVKSKVPWKIDPLRFKTYLTDKYSVRNAYYFIGHFNEKHKKLYEKIENSGFILVFKEHDSIMRTKKKGNVDSDIIFSLMKKLYKKEPFDKTILVSGDGDYKMLVDFLIEENRFCKILFPKKSNASSLYKKISVKYFDSLDTVHIKQKIQFIKEKRPSDD